MFKHLALTNWFSKYTLWTMVTTCHKQGVYSGNKVGFLQVLYASVCWLFFCVFLFCFLFFFLRTLLVFHCLKSESTNGIIFRGTEFGSYSAGENTEFGLHFYNCVFVTHKTTPWSLVFKWFVVYMSNEMAINLG